MTQSEDISERALALHRTAIVIDTHVDTVIRWLDLEEDLGTSTGNGYMDLPLMESGNLTAAFFACCVGFHCVGEGTAVRRALDMIDAVKEMCARYPDRIGLARDADDVRSLAAEGKLAAILSLEGGHAIDDDLRVLRQFFELGVRYMSLTHFNTHDWADSATDEPRHDGLSPFGREVVAEMDRLGMIIDVSHASDRVFWEVIELARKPVIASHSSARALVDHPRNMTDEMMRALAERGGVVCVTAWPEYISTRYWQALEAEADRRSGRSERGANRRKSTSGSTSAISDLMAGIRGDRWASYNVLMDTGITPPSLDDWLDHVDYAVGVAGIDHVGLGSDHGAVRFDLQGLETCARLPALTESLLSRGYDDDAVRKLLGENVLRLMADVICQ